MSECADIERDHNSLLYQPEACNQYFGDLDTANNHNHFRREFLEFQKVLHDRVSEILKSTANEEDSNKKKDILNVLFNDLTCRLDTSLTDKLELTTPRRYYEVLAEYYVMYPEKAAAIHQIEIDALWDNNQFKIISGLIMYLWVFSHCLKRKYYNNLIQTANKLFVLDIEHSTKRFQPVYEYLYKNILSSPTLWNSYEVQRLILDIFSLVSKYYFYYNTDVTAASLKDFFAQTQSALSSFKDKLEYPKGHTKIQTVNMFVNEIVRQLKSSKNEMAIVLYLERLALFGREIEIPGTKTRINLRTVLLDYSTPGLPYYPTRKMRDHAKKAMDLLFPVGKMTRQATNWVFRFLSPIDLLRSWWFWIFSWVSGLLLLFGKSSPSDKSLPIQILPLDTLENELVKGAYTTENEKDK